MNRIVTLPNILSLFRILLTPLFIVCIFVEGSYRLLAFLIFTIAAATDFCDGYLARARNVRSKWGIFLDPLADKILVLSAFIAFYVFGVIELWMVMVIIVRDVFVTTFRIASLCRGKHLSSSRLGKWKTTLQLISIYCILAFIFFRSTYGLQLFPKLAARVSHLSIIPILMYLVVGITLYSGVIYFVRNFAFLKRLFTS